MEMMGAFPIWEIGFDEDGNRVGSGAAALLAEVPKQGLTDLFIFAHGWNNSRSVARDLYGRVFGQMAKVMKQPGVQLGRQVTIGTAGVIWPSMLWADEPGAPVAAAADVAGPMTDRTLIEGLRAVYDKPDQIRAIDEMAELLERRPEDEAALERFQALLRPLVAGPDTQAAPEDNTLGCVLVAQPARDVFERLGGEAPAADDEGGAAGFLDDVKATWAKAWEGAKTAARQATYWQMKKRAGVVGQRGLGPLIGDLHREAPDLHIHLIGHSFGARLVSFALAGLPADAIAPGQKAVKSVTLLQGAFSHFAFAASLPFAPDRAGALAGMEQRVDGPLVVTHSKFDTAVGSLYPAASFVSREDAAKADDLMYRWEGMGYDGAQTVDAGSALLGAVGTRYRLSAGKFLNLDANDVIVNGGPPSGAHSDIVYPQIAWATFAAAGIV